MERGNAPQYTAPSSGFELLQHILEGRVYRITTDDYPALGNLVHREPGHVSDHAESCLIAFAENGGGVFVDGVAAERVYWDHNAVGWTALASKFPEGRLCVF
jgi:hypothetical protein